jgi:hypothetical protein
MKTAAEMAEMRHRQDIHEKMMEIADKDQRIRQLEALVEQLKQSQERLTRERDSWRDRAVQLEKPPEPAKERPASSGQWQDKYPSASTFTPPADTDNTYGDPKDVATSSCGMCKAVGACICMDVMQTETSTSVFLAAVPLSLGPGRSSPPPEKQTHVHKTTEDPATVFAEREIDFTAQFSTKKPRVEKHTVTSIAYVTEPSHVAQPTQVDAECGFCTADTYCICRNEYKDEVPSQVISWNDATPTEAKRPATASVSTGPGSCDACQRDPQQRAWCQRVAELKSSANDYGSRSPRSRASSTTLSPMEPRTSYAAVDTHMSNSSSIGCNDAYKLFKDRVPTDRESLDWSTLKPIAPDTNRDPLPSIGSRTYSALELDTASVIMTLGGRARGPLIPRKEDGAHADLVKLAQEYRRSSNSPLLS